MTKIHEKSGSGPPPATARKRVIAYLLNAAAFLLIAASALGVMLLWRPAPPGSVPSRLDLADAIHSAGLAGAAIELTFFGQAAFTIGQQELADIASAALVASRALAGANGQSSHPGVPPEVETLEGIAIGTDEVLLCLRLRRRLALYVTIGGRLLHQGDGGLDFSLSSARIGLVPLPAGWVRRFLHPGDFELLNPEVTGLRIDELIQQQGSIELVLSVIDDYEGSECEIDT